MTRWQRFKEGLRKQCMQWLARWEEDNAVGLHSIGHEHLPDMPDTIDHSHGSGEHHF